MDFLRQFVIYGLSGAASRLAALVLMPLYTHSLSILQYGALELLLAIHALVVLMGGLQVESAVARDYLKALEGDAPQAYRWTALSLILAGTSAVGGLLALAWWAGALPTHIEGSSIVLLMVLTAPVQLFAVQLIMLRFSGKAVAFALLSFSDLSLSAFFSWVFIIALDQGLDGALMGLLAGKLACIALAWPITMGLSFRPAWRSSMAREMLTYGLPSLPAVFVVWLQNTGNRVLLASVLTLNDVALAGVAMKVSSLYGFVIYSFRLAWEPYAMARLDAPDGQVHDFNQALEIYVATMFLFCGLAVVLGPTVVSLLSPASYAAAGLLAGAFIVGQFWVGATHLMVIGIHGARQPGRLLPVYAIGVALNVALLLGLAPWLGVGAAGLGFFGGAVASALLAGYYSNTLFRAGFHWRLVTTALVGSLALLVLLDGFLAMRPAVAAGRLTQSSSELIQGVLVSLSLTVAVLWLGCGTARFRDLLAVAMRLLLRGKGTPP